MDMPTAVLDKIRSDDLRNEAVAETSEPHTVIVELDLPLPNIEAVAPMTAGLRGKPRFRLAAPTDTSRRTEASRIEASRDGITSITGAPPETYLPTSASFVVKASGEQIGRIAQMSSVSAIWPNSRRGR